jgi:integrase
MRGHIRRQGRNSWAIVIHLGRANDGKYKYQWTTAYGSKKDAEAELNRLLAKMPAGGLKNRLDGTKTLETFLNGWLDNHARHQVTPKTLARYTDIVEREIIPALGSIRLNRLTPEAIQKAYGAFGRRLSPQTVLHHHRLLFSALAQAERWEIISRNPAALVDPPKVKHQAPAQISEKAAKELLLALRGTLLETPTLIAIATGMRRGEILALKWADVDLAEGWLQVVRSVEQVRDKVAYKQTKTAKGRRRIPLPAFAVIALRSHKARQSELRMRLGSRYTDNDLVCPRDDGSLWPPDYFTSSFIWALRSRKLPPMRFHDLRHAHASWLLKAGEHLKVVQERLGHSSIGITSDTYSHVADGIQEKAAAALDKAFRKAI